MATGLVLGWTSALEGLWARAEVESDALTVMTADAETVAELTERGVEAVEADPLTADPPELALPPPVVLVADPDPGRARRLIHRARSWYPSARVIAYAGAAATPGDREALRTAADRLLDHAELLAQATLDSGSSAAAVRAFRVRRILRELDGPVCIFTHDNPDPDAIASAAALVRVAEQLNVPARAHYYGEITHQSNRAFINALDLPITQLDDGESPGDCSGFALVDHAIAGRNNALDPQTKVDIIIDHHRPTEPIEAKFVDVRENVGSTCAILYEYVTEFNVELDTELATALLYGITTDTRRFTRKPTTLDFRAAAALWTIADHAVLDRIEAPGTSHPTLQTIANAIENRTVRGRALTAFVGAAPDKDALAQAAELLVQMEDVTIALVYGLDDGVVYASARARRPPAKFDLSTVIRDAFAQIGSAGGHEEMAGAQIPIGYLGSEVSDDDAGLGHIVTEIVEDRFFDAVQGAFGVDGAMTPGQLSGTAGDVFDETE